MTADTEAREHTDPLPGTDAYRVKFKGLSRNGNLIEPPPDIGHEVTYTVHTRCSEIGHILMRDGEMRDVRGMDVVSVVAQGPPVRPDSEPGDPDDDG
ncbi:MAG: hypothetical protein ACRDTZ_01240 [Pseudonocardiaceae bacterium]